MRVTTIRQPTLVPTGKTITGPLPCPFLLVDFLGAQQPDFNQFPRYKHCYFRQSKERPCKTGPFTQSQTEARPVPLGIIRALLLVFIGKNQNRLSTFRNHISLDNRLFNIIHGWQIKHDVEQGIFNN